MADWSDNRAFHGLIRRASTIAAANMAVQQELTAAFNHRYGTTYSDVDADQIIDVLDQGGGSLSGSECDEIMAGAGCPRIDQ
jgi:hypothetical protein